MADRTRRPVLDVCVGSVQFMEQIPPHRRVIRLFPDYARGLPALGELNALMAAMESDSRLQDEVQSFADVQREFGPWRDRR